MLWVLRPYVDYLFGNGGRLFSFSSPTGGGWIFSLAGVVGFSVQRGVAATCRVDDPGWVCNLRTPQKTRIGPHAPTASAACLATARREAARLPIVWRQLECTPSAACAAQQRSLHNGAHGSQGAASLSAVGQQISYPLLCAVQRTRRARLPRARAGRPRTWRRLRCG